MRTIWEIQLWYRADEVGFDYALPEGALFLAAGFQGGYPGFLYAWFEVDDAFPVEKRRFATIGTGQEIPADARYLGTAQESGHPLVWHIYELPISSDTPADAQNGP